MMLLHPASAATFRTDRRPSRASSFAQLRVPNHANTPASSRHGYSSTVPLQAFSPEMPTGDKREVGVNPARSRRCEGEASLDHFPARRSGWKDCFLEFADHPILDIIERCVLQGATQVTLLPFFSGADRSSKERRAQRGTYGPSALP